MSQKCAICGAAVYTADPQINLDGKLLHKPCAKCSDCKCQITVDNFSKAEVGGKLTLFCHTHYLKRFGESGGSYLDGERFANKADRDLLRGSVLEKAAQPEFKAVDGLVTKDIPEGLRYEEFASSFSDALHVTNTNVPAASTARDFPFEDAAPLETRRKSLQTSSNTGSTPGSLSDFPLEAADVDSRRKSLQSAYASTNSGGGGGGGSTDFPFQDAVPLEERKRSLAGAGSLSADLPLQTPVAGSFPPSTSSTDTSPPLGYSGGSFNAAGQRCGHADFASPSGSSYTGEWLDGLMHGAGRLALSNGSVYEGQFLGSLYHGHGTFRSCHGYTYEGEWRDGQMHGQGRYTFIDGRIVVGEWSLDVLLKGVTVFPNL